MPQCKALTNQLYIDVSGYYTPCCMIVNKKNKNLVTVSSPEEWLNSNDMQSIRSNMNDNEWDINCESCKFAEQENRESFREIYNREYTQSTGTVEAFLINTRNKCNIRCRMCSPNYSNKWAVTRKVIPISTTLGFKDQYEKIKHLIGPNFKYLKIAGGEPFLDNEVPEVIELILEKCPNVDIQFNTNMTFFPKKYIHILDKVKVLRPIYSIDGIGLVNDYIRHDSIWDTTSEVLSQWTNYMRDRSQPRDQQFFQTAVQSYNFHDLHNIKSLMNSLNVDWITVSVGYPTEFALNALPPEYIQKHTNEVNKNFVANYNFDQNLFAQLKARTIDDDNLLGKNIKDYIPELYELLNS
jgi:radical SAM protein with 4Fe4S-binding SPASM domain